MGVFFSHASILGRTVAGPRLWTASYGTNLGTASRLGELGGMTALVAMTVTMVASVGLSLVATDALAETQEVDMENDAFRLTLTLEGTTIAARFEDKASGLRLADGPCRYRAQPLSAPEASLSAVSIREEDGNLVVRGKLAGLDMTQTFALPAGKPLVEEHIVLRNGSTEMVSLSDLEIGFTWRTHGDSAEHRWIAVPLRHRATDPRGHCHDFAVARLLAEPGWVPHITNQMQYTQVPSRHRVSEGWARLWGGRAFGVFKFSQECLQFSVVSKFDEHTLRFGGACMISGEPAALTRIAPGQRVDLGITRYESVAGGYEDVAYAFRRMLDEFGCRFPETFDPPVHWEQLYDMEGAWDERPIRYTRAAIEAEAAKGVAYSCEALYLDPGWDTRFASFRWGDEWLGPQKQFVADIESKYRLRLSLHCPLAPWMSSVFTMGPSALDDWPKEALRLAPREEFGELEVPAKLTDGRRNLALLPEAMASASSVYSEGAMPIHQVAHLNDGWYGNSASWIAGDMPCWAQVDLGGEYDISEVRLGNEHLGAYRDRAATELKVMVATSPHAWQTVAEYRGEALTAALSLPFEPKAARYVRVEITASRDGLPRLDEIEIYEASPSDNAFAPRRSPRPKAPANTPQMCLGARQYLDEAERRLHKLCEDGAVYLMFDGNWWGGECVDTSHGHPVPYRWEDHIRANVELCRRIHAKFPKVIIEMHDMLAGGNIVRMTPVYYKYGLPGSYDENWGFELMWDPMSDLKEGRAESLYYYNLGCNVPLYLHIDLRKDNEECVVLWWYASTCRHLGIGGTHSNPAVVRAQQDAMRHYSQWKEFFKRGEFYGAGPEVHFHVLPERKAFVVNVFNLSDEERTITGEIPLTTMGLSGDYVGDTMWGATMDGVFRVSAKLPPWSARVGAYRLRE